MKSLDERKADRAARRAAEVEASDHPETMVDINEANDDGKPSKGTSKNKPASNKGGGKSDPGGEASGGAGWSAQ